MGPQARDEYLAQMRDRYVRASRTEKGRMLTEAVTVTGYHRKAIIRVWQRPAVRRARGRRRGRPTRYDAAVVTAHVTPNGASATSCASNFAACWSRENRTTGCWQAAEMADALDSDADGTFRRVWCLIRRKEDSR